MSLSLKEPLIQACQKLLPKYGIKEHSFVCEMSEKTLNSGDSINLLVGLSRGAEGNIVFGMTKESSFQILSAILGVEEIFTLDNNARNVLSTFVSSICKETFYKIRTKKGVSISSPTLITGERICLMISNTPANKAFFKINKNKFNVAYSIEGELCE